MLHHLIEGRVQSKEFTVTVGLALVFIVPVNLLIGSTIEQVREEGVREGVLQVKDAAGPAATRGVVYRHRPPLQVILQNNRHVNMSVSDTLAQSNNDNERSFIGITPNSE